MPLVTGKQIWTQQPQGLVQLSANARSRKPIFCFLPSAGPIELVNNISFTVSSTPSFKPDSSGIGLYSAAKGSSYQGYYAPEQSSGSRSDLLYNVQAPPLTLITVVRAGGNDGYNIVRGNGSGDAAWAAGGWNGTFQGGAGRVKTTGGTLSLSPDASYFNCFNDINPGVVVLSIGPTTTTLYAGLLGGGILQTQSGSTPSGNFYYEYNDQYRCLSIGAGYTGSADRTYLAFGLASEFSAEEAQRVITNPWALFKKQNKRIWVPTAGGGATTISCTPGNATTAGIAAGISAATTIACTPGGASTAGVACALPIKIACNVGNATPTGIACSLQVVVQCNAGTATTAGVSAGIALDSSITISCNAGTATTSGVSASFPQTLSCTPGNATTAGNSATFPQSLSCNVGNATTAGITAQVDIAGQIVIGCNAGTATTAGIQASVSSAIVLACSAGTATTLGATAYFPQSLQCSPGNAIAVGIDATFTVAGPTTIVCNVGNATASGISFSFGGTLVDAPNGSGPAIIIPRGTRGAVQNTTRPPNIGGIRI